MEDTAASITYNINHKRLSTVQYISTYPCIFHRNVYEFLSKFNKRAGSIVLRGMAGDSGKFIKKSQK